MMKYYTPLLSLLVGLLLLGPDFTPATSPTEENCSVKIASLDGTYDGECKNGLAEGKGIAVGKDEYQGEFKSGLPHGKGRYIYANGDEYIGEFRKGRRHGKGYLKKSGEVTIENNPRIMVWKNDQLMGEILKGEYNMSRQRNIARSSFKLLDTETNRVDIVIQSPLQINNIMVNLSSGRYDLQGRARIVIYEPKFPLTVLLEYETPDRLNSQILKVLADFQLESAGRWEINLGN